MSMLLSGSRFPARASHKLLATRIHLRRCHGRIVPRILHATRPYDASHPAGSHHPKGFEDDRTMRRGRETAPRQRMQSGDVDNDPAHPSDGMQIGLDRRRIARRARRPRFLLREWEPISNPPHIPDTAAHLPIISAQHPNPPPRIYRTRLPGGRVRR
jgi:hypothetical protein